jgi:hypothetical protein
LVSRQHLSMFHRAASLAELSGISGQLPPLPARC